MQAQRVARDGGVAGDEQQRVTREKEPDEQAGLGEQDEQYACDAESVDEVRGREWSEKREVGLHDIGG
jgi:hypothetical protein